MFILIIIKQIFKNLNINKTVYYNLKQKILYVYIFLSLSI